jgi:cysteine synthase
MSKPTSPELSRRRVFAGVGTAGALAAVAAVLPIARPAAPAVAAAVPSPTPGDDEQGRYKLTQHVQRYYRTAQV